MNEIWRDIPGFEGLYEVSNLGQVRNTKRGTIVAASKDKRNYGSYMKISLWKNGKRYNFKVHRLQALAFIPNPDNLPEVNHKDENPDNNFIWVNPDGTVDFEKSNLEWCSAKYNSNYGNHGKKLSRVLTNNKKKSTPVVQKLNGIIISTYPSQAEVQRQKGFCQANINKCLKGIISTAYGYEWEYLN